MYTPMQRIEQAKVSLFRDPRFAYMAGLFMIGKTTITDDIPTARTNGRDVEFNPEFVQSLDDAELRAVVYHEYGGHILYRHLSVFKFLYEQDGRLANMACDYVINQIIKDFNSPQFIRLPKCGLQNDRFRGMDSKQVFDILKEEDPDGGGGTGQTMDSHDWEGAGQISEQEEQALVKELNTVLRQGVMASKLLGHPVDREVLRNLNPEVDWREALRDFMTTQCAGNDYSTYRRPRRRMMASGIYLPTPMSNSVPSILVAVDTSGSVDDVQVAKFLAEVAGVCETVCPEEVHLLYWGSRVVGHEVYTSDMQDMLRDVTRPMCGGGTDVNCVTQYMEENQLNPTCVLVLTDGYLAGSWGNWHQPILWGITTYRVADVGTTIRLTL